MTDSVSRSDLVDYIASGEKPREKFRIGTEHEKFAFFRQDLRPVPFEGPAGIEALLRALADEGGWEAHHEKGQLIALHKAGASITLEPGGQFELSGAPLENLHQTCSEVNEHLAQIKQVVAAQGIGFLGMGFHPLWPRENFPWMPKERYRIMRAYMPKVGTRGLDMMVRTCTVQVNLDYSSERDMVRKFRLGLALQPIATALFANSPFSDGKPSGYISSRAQTWRDVDSDRTGPLEWVFDDSMGYERWVDYVLDVPMYFVRRDGRHIDASGQSFRSFLEGRLPALAGEKPLLSDFEDHLTTVFPEVRLKTFLEMRGADAGPWKNICALPAFWVGLLYDEHALEACENLVSTWTSEDRSRLYDEVPRLGLRARAGQQSALEVARELLRVCSEGLARRARRNAVGEDERGFLSPLSDIVARGTTQSEEMLALYNGEWEQRVEPLFDLYSY